MQVSPETETVTDEGISIGFNPILDITTKPHIGLRRQRALRALRGL